MTLSLSPLSRSANGTINSLASPLTRMPGALCSWSPRPSVTSKTSARGHYVYCARFRLIAAEDTRRTARLLARYAISTPTTSFHRHNESSKLATLLKRLQQGEDLALVSDAGTPTISDPGQQLVRAAIEAGVRVEPIPGPSAVLAAPRGVRN